jgi:hypothetical protein
MQKMVAVYPTATNIIEIGLQGTLEFDETNKAMITTQNGILTYCSGTVDGLSRFVRQEHSTGQQHCLGEMFHRICLDDLEQYCSELRTKDWKDQNGPLPLLIQSTCLIDWQGLTETRHSEVVHQSMEHMLWHDSS